MCLEKTGFWSAVTSPAGGALMEDERLKKIFLILSILLKTDLRPPENKIQVTNKKFAIIFRKDNTAYCLSFFCGLLLTRYSFLGLDRSGVILLGSISHVLLYDTYSVSCLVYIFQLMLHGWECIWLLSVWVVGSIGEIGFNTVVLFKIIWDSAILFIYYLFNMLPISLSKLTPYLLVFFYLPAFHSLYMLYFG